MRKFLFFGVLLLAACSGSAERAGAEKAVLKFHQQLNSAAYEQIYAASDSGLKKATSKADMVKLLEAVHSKLGAFQTGTQSGWQVNYNTGGNNTVIQFDSNFQKGKATETFTFVGNSDAPRLLAYNVNSPVLITG
jgi:hypothetical protein